MTWSRVDIQTHKLRLLSSIFHEAASCARCDVAARASESREVGDSITECKSRTEGHSEMIIDIKP